ncbi:cupin domain-containing protein [Roseibium album]|uniref:cupin domain-containing protein n=1 Tax=Roseibium album TaxID=311410 RepID=UPI00249287A8|nr:cupin domain-containing protein [Roseibium album]
MSGEAKMNFRLFPIGLFVAACLATASATAADKSITPNGKPAPSQPLAKPDSQAAEPNGSATTDNESYDKVRQVYAGDLTVAGEKVVFPEGNQSVKALEITMEPGEVTGWHKHGAPLFAYMLEGEITVTYDGIGKKLYRQGEGLLEAMNVTHRGENTGDGPARILAVFLLGDNSHAVVAEEPPGSDQQKIQ